MSKNRHKAKVPLLVQAQRQDLVYYWFRFGLRSIIVVLALLALGLFVSLVVNEFASGNKTASDQVPATKPAISPSMATALAPVAAASNVYGDLDPGRVAELQKFGSEVVFPLLQSTVLKSYHPLKQVDDRFKYVAEAIKQQFGERVKVNASLNYLPGVPKDTVAAAHVTSDRVPWIFLSLASVQDLFKVCTNSGPNGTVEFMNNLVVIFEHEMEHLAFSNYNGQLESYEQFVAEEAKTFHNSCQYVIGPILADNPQAYPPAIVMLYRAWEKGGRQLNSPSWIAYVRLQYPEAQMNLATNSPKK